MSDTKLKPEKPDKPKKKDKIYNVLFKENRVYECTINHKFYRWEPRGKPGNSQVLTEKEINHSDFISCKNRFIIEGVK